MVRVRLIGAYYNPPASAQCCECGHQIQNQRIHQLIPTIMAKDGASELALVNIAYRLRKQTEAQKWNETNTPARPGGCCKLSRSGCTCASKLHPAWTHMRIQAGCSLDAHVHPSWIQLGCTRASKLACPRFLCMHNVLVHALKGPGTKAFTQKTR